MREPPVVDVSFHHHNQPRFLAFPSIKPLPAPPQTLASTYSLSFPSCAAALLSSLLLILFRFSEFSANREKRQSSSSWRCRHGHRRTAPAAGTEPRWCPLQPRFLGQAWEAPGPPRRRHLLPRFSPVAAGSSSTPSARAQRSDPHGEPRLRALFPLASLCSVRPPSSA